MDIRDWKEDYLGEISEQIRCRRARPLVTEEIAQHMEEEYEERVEAGVKEEEAQQAVLRNMGNAQETGAALNRIHRPKMEWRLLIGAILLFLLGIGVQYVLISESINGTYYFTRQIGNAICGIVVMLFVYFVDYTWIGRRAISLYWGVVLGSFLMTVLSGWFEGALFFRYFVSVNGVRRNLTALVFLLIPVFAGILYQQRQKGMQGFLVAQFYACFGAFYVGILSRQTAALFFYLLVCMAMSGYAVLGKGWFGAEKRRKMLLLMGWNLAAAVAAVLIMGSARYQLERIHEAFLGWMGRGSESDNYQIAMLHQFLGQAKPFEGTASIKGYLEGQTDMVWVGLICKIGSVASVLLMAVFLAVAVYALVRSMRQRIQMGSMMGFGCAFALLAEGVAYLAFNLGLLPFGIIYMPFLSYGLGNTITSGILVGLMLSIYRNSDLVKDDPAQTAPFRYRLQVKLIKESN